MKKKILYIILFSCFLGFSQKQIEKTFHIRDLKTIDFKLNHVFRITLKTLRTNHVIIKAKSEGEFANYFTLNSKEGKSNLFIESALDFTFQDKNDKLSAHKVQAIDIEISIPENLSVTLRSDIANLIAQGKYESLVAQLDSGNCTLKNVRDEVKVNTIIGDINAFVNYATIVAETRQGEINIEELTKGKTNYVLKSIKGDIKVKKTQ